MGNPQKEYSSLIHFSFYCGLGPEVNSHESAPWHCLPWIYFPWNKEEKKWLDLGIVGILCIDIFLISLFNMVIFVLFLSWISVAPKAKRLLSLYVSSHFLKLLNKPITPVKPLEILNFETSLKVTIFNLRLWQDLYIFERVLQTPHVLGESIHFIASTSSLRSPRNSEFRCIFYRFMFTIYCWIKFGSKWQISKEGLKFPWF